MDKKQEILKAAFDIFCEKGYQLTLSELAVTVGIKTPSLYSHFASKDEIIELVVREEIRKYYSRLTVKMAEVKCMSCREALRYLFVFVIEFFSKDQRLRFWRAIPLIQNYQLKTVLAQLIRDNDKLFRQEIQQLFSKGQSDGEIRPDVSPGALPLYLCMIQGVLDGILLYPGTQSGASNAEELFQAYWDGISVL